MLMYSSSFLASVQESLPPPEDPWTFQTPNLLHRDDIWSHPATAPARGGNWRCDWELHVRWDVTFEETFCLLRWFSSWERDRIVPPKPAEASLCPCSLSRASTMTLSSAHLPPPRRSWTLEPTFTALRLCLAQRSRCSLLGTKANARKCLCDCGCCYWHSKSALPCCKYISTHFFTFKVVVNIQKYNNENQVRVMV